MQAPARAFREPAKPLAVAIGLMGVGVLAVLAAIGADRAPSLQPGFVSYCAGTLYLALLAIMESRRSAPVQALPAWLSPPALIAGWAVVWIYAPAAMAFVDDELLDDLAVAQGGHTLLGAGLLLACVATTMLWSSYHLTRRIAGSRS